MSVLTAVGMNTNGQLSIAGPNDLISTAAGNNNAVFTLFTMTSSATVTNSTAETSIIGAGTGSTVIVANTVMVGRTIRLEGYGVYSAAAVLPGNLTIKVKLGSTVIATSTLSAILASASTLGYQFSADITFRTIGASGTVMIGGSLDYATTSSGTRTFADLNNNGSTTTIDTTSNQTIGVTVTWATASTSNIITNNVTTIEQIW